MVHPLDCHLLDGRHATEPVGELSRGRTARLERDIRAARSCFGAQTIIQAAETGTNVAFYPMYWNGFVGMGRP